LAESQLTVDNPSKTQVIWLGFSQQLDKIDISSMHIMSTRVAVSDTVRDLGVIIDSRLTLADQVAAVCRSGYYQMRQLRSVVRSLSVHGTAAVVHAFIACLLDYCNYLLTGVNDGVCSSDCLITGTRRIEHITPVLRQLHWLPIRQLIRYKLATLVFRALSGQAPDYPVDEP